jgi:hypothetical protein
MSVFTASEVPGKKFYASVISDYEHDVSVTDHKRGKEVRLQITRMIPNIEYQRIT